MTSNELFFTRNKYGSIKNYIFILCLFAFSTASALAKTYIREYTYTASEADSKITSRINALDQVKVLLLQEIGTHIQQVIRITKDKSGLLAATEDIEAMAAGLTKVKILDEKWNGKTFYIKAEIIADTDQVLKSLDALKNQKNREALLILERSKENQIKLKEARNEIEKLRSQLSSTKTAREKETLVYKYKKQIEKINPSSASKELSCLAAGYGSNKNFKELTTRQAISDPLFTAKIEPKNTELIFKHNSSKYVANFTGQYLMTPEGDIVEDLTLKGVIYDQYVNADRKVLYQFYIPAGNHQNTLYSKMIWLTVNLETEETYIVIFECVRE